MHRIKSTFCAALLMAALPIAAFAAAECPEPTSTQGVETINGALTVSQKVEIQPVLWVANAGEDTVSKIDTSLNKEVARYSTGFWRNYYGWRLPSHGAWSGPAPSRSAVDTDGNAYVANRGFGRIAEVMKILTSGCVDRNNNGTCDTSTDTNGDGRISQGEMKQLIDTNGNGRIDDNEIQDERVAWIKRVGSYNEVARGLAIDKSGNLWVGMYNTRRIYKVDGKTGATLGSWYIGVRPYGAAVDSKGRLFTAGLGSGHQRRIDTANPTSQTGYYVSSGYGLAVGRDHNGKEWVVTAHHGNYGFQRLDPDTLHRTFPGGYNRFAPLGISFDSDGHIVVSGARYWGSRGAAKLRTDGSIVWTRTPASDCSASGQRGAIVDANNDIWVVSLGNHKVCKYLSNGTVSVRLPVGRSPYTYSDASGIGLQFSDPTGKVVYQSDAGTIEFDWADGDLCYEGSGDVTVTAAAADTIAGLEFANPAAIAVSDNGAGKLCGKVPAGVKGRYLQITFTIKTGGKVVVEDENGDCAAPEIPQANEPPVAICIAPVTLSANGQCKAAIPNADNGSNDPDGADDIASLTQSPAEGTLVGPGAHDVTVKITDKSDESAMCTTKVTVVDDTPPTADAGPDQTLKADATCSASTTSDGLGTDNCGVASYAWTDANGGAAGSTSTFSGSWTGLGTYGYTLKVCDTAGTCVTDDLSIKLVDETAPSAACGIAAEGYTPPSWGEGPVQITATGADNCGTVTLTVGNYSATMLNGGGKLVDKTEDANASWSGATLSIGDSQGSGTVHAWTVTAEDGSGNKTVIQCSFEVQNPGNAGGNGKGNGKGKGKK